MGQMGQAMGPKGRQGNLKAGPGAMRDFKGPRDKQVARQGGAEGKNGRPRDNEVNQQA